MKEKKREITDWEKAECLELKALLDAFNLGKARKDSLTQGKIADRLEISQGAVSAYLNGYNALNARVASVIASMLGCPVERFSPRLAKEIAEMAEAVRPRPSSESNSEQADTYQQAQRAAALMDFATPRTRSVLERINQAALAGRLTDADLDLLDQIAARFESSEGEQHASQQGSHQRLREKLQKNDPHTRK